MSDSPIIFRPSRKFRREIAGTVCPACHVRMFCTDVVTLRTEDGLTALHFQCAEAIAQRAELEEIDES